MFIVVDRMACISPSPSYESTSPLVRKPQTTDPFVLRLSSMAIPLVKAAASTKVEGVAEMCKDNLLLVF